MRSRNNSREDGSPLYVCSCSDEEDNEFSLEQGLASHRGDKVTLPPYPIHKSTGSIASDAVPGRPKRRKKTTTEDTVTRKRRSSKPSWQCICTKLNLSGYGTLLLAVMLWYTLGVVAISTSKVLLTPSKYHANSPRYYFHVGGLSPLVLTVQQLLLGSSLLRFLLGVRFLNSPGLQPWESLGTLTPSNQVARYRRRENATSSSISSLLNTSKSLPNRHLLLAGISFSIGFWATNLGFSGNSASFVETIKAAEPITSATLAVSWGLEHLTAMEISSLTSIVAGVVLSTLGNTGTSSPIVGDNTVWASFLSCVIVMVSNLCFSFRGLYQKLFHREGGAADDINLQFRMQQIGVLILILPTLVWDGPAILRHVYNVFTNVGLFQNGLFFRYCSLALVNGLAFTSYNLASTYLLSRITVVHHAALNCVRRIFAIIVTSIVFGVPITISGSAGILLSFLGFMAFTYAKTKKTKRPKPFSSLLPMGSSEIHRA